MQTAEEERASLDAALQYIQYVQTHLSPAEYARFGALFNKVITKWTEPALEAICHEVTQLFEGHPRELRFGVLHMPGAVITVLNTKTQK